ncbi:acyl-CoA dehydrogenase family protein [Hydrogenophaga sp. YM1]|uniref:acyl-CoA dehydrogenase family protein n=1 Tax=Hydrogenophaga TaxID=47420 RepID=UPI000AC1FD3D|nr:MULTISPECIES: acyl-CoA dehydrogenase family protein [unclassified Hydrogenophaga]MBN9372895.1 acyl-CoA dehydrogenase family protein [Hydrogenophaga sp.]QRR33575.1 acyl-CoA dehydrogenase family protein [Hydrogenophaga sp. YM1]
MVAFDRPHGMTPPQAQWELPFFGEHHRALALGLADWAGAQQVDESDDRRACRDWVRRLGESGWLRYCVPAAHGGALDKLDSRALVVLRETLAFHSPLADFAFAMQGLGSGSITLGGSEAQREQRLRAVASGAQIAAFALSEPEAGSDVAGMRTRARPVDGGWALDGSKTWISNGGLADFYVVFAKTTPDAGARGISAFVVPADAPGLDTTEHIDVMAPHPLATLRFKDCRVGADALVGAVDGGFKLAMQTLDIFRASVAAAALGMARRAFAEAVAHAKRREMFGQHLADFQLTQARLGEMSALIDAGAMLTYRAAWMRDESASQGAGTPAYTAAAAAAKLTATENAQRVIDMAVQMFGGRGVRVGEVVEHLYRDIRSLRIYEGASEVQLLILGKNALR